ncbi:hypothetical protein WB44_00700 [Synechococcus sp. WH 8020]|nr:hypothetical protein WB44_00700 [Synechococcus sp. WH 8020]
MSLCATSEGRGLQPVRCDHRDSGHQDGSPAAGLGSAPYAQVHQRGHGPQSPAASDRSRLTQAEEDPVMRAWPLAP